MNKPHIKWVKDLHAWRMDKVCSHCNHVEPHIHSKLSEFTTMSMCSRCQAINDMNKQMVATQHAAIQLNIVDANAAYWNNYNTFHDELRRNSSPWYSIWR